MTTSALALYDPGVPADPSELSRDQLVELGRKVAAVESVSKWALGDLACQVETSYGGADLGKYAEEIGVEWSTLRDYAQVSQAFSQSVARATHSWSVYRVLAAQPDRAELVAREQPWTYREAEHLRAGRALKSSGGSSGARRGRGGRPGRRPPSWRPPGGRRPSLPR